MATSRGRRNTWCELNPNDVPVSGKKKENVFPIRRTSAYTDSAFASSKTSNLFSRRFRSNGSSKELRVSRDIRPVNENEVASSASTDFDNPVNWFLWELPLAAFTANSEHLLKQQTVSITQNGSSYSSCSILQKESPSSCTQRRGSFAPLMGHQYSLNAAAMSGGSNVFPLDLSSLPLNCNSVGSNSNISSVVAEEDKTGGSLKAKARLQNLFNVKDKDTMEKLKELLDMLSCGGFEVEFNFPSQQFLKESNWYELSVDSEEDMIQSKMTKQEKDYQEAVWELLKSELLYMEKLKVLSDVFLTSLEEIQKEGILVEVSIERLFGNLRAVCQAHLTFWLDHLQPVLERARENKQLINAIDICDAFLQIESLFEPHMTYIKDQESCTQYARSTYQTNQIFKVFVMWCESQKMCGRLKLTDLLVKPVQRLAQYPLLLQAILKNSSLKEEQSALKQALSCAQQFLAQVNSTLQFYSEQEKVFILNERLEAFDFFDFQNEDLCQVVEKYSKFDITSPPMGMSVSNAGNGSRSSAMRKLLVEGPWRLKESSKGKMDVYAYLFVDVLIVTKHAGNRKSGASGGIPKLKPIHPPMGVSQLVVTPVSSAGQDPLQQSYNSKNGMIYNQIPSISTGSFTVVYLNECNVIMSAFLVNVGSPSNAYVWISGINNAKKQFVPPVPPLEHRNSLMTAATSASSYSVENSPNQRMPSKIADQIRTLFSPTALSMEDEDDVSNAHSSANNLFMTPVNHFSVGGGSSPQEIPRSQRSIKKASCGAEDTNTTASKPFNSKSTPNLSVDLSYLAENNLISDGSAFSPSASPPLSPMSSKKNSAGACTPLTLSPHLSDFGRKFMRCSASVFNNSYNNNCHSGNTSFFVTPVISSSAPFASVKTSRSKFPLPKRKISDSAVPISYAYYNYNCVKCSCGSYTCNSTANSSPLSDIPDDSSKFVCRSRFSEFSMTPSEINRPNNFPQQVNNKESDIAWKSSFDRSHRKTSFLMPSPSRQCGDNQQDKATKKLTLSSPSILNRGESLKPRSADVVSKPEKNGDLKVESKSSDDISKTILLISQLPNSTGKKSEKKNQCKMNHQISINIESAETEDC